MTAPKTTRQTVPKRTRFEVFKRDHFTCQYCGTQPPAGVLVLDHIVPVARGGASTLDNLMTACEACNQGKADKSLGHVPIRPDADLLYLETQQEIAELERYRTVLARKEASIAKLIPRFQQMWCAEAATHWFPDDAILRTLVQRRALESVEEALHSTADKVRRGHLGRYRRGYHGIEGPSDDWVPYLFGVARKIDEGASWPA